MYSRYFGTSQRMLLVLLTTWLLVSTMATSVAPSNIIYTFETDPTYSPSEMPDGAQIQMGESDARTALVALYKAANGPSWIRQDCWITCSNICDWHGVYCSDNGTVFWIDLKNNNLTGYLPSEIGFLTDLVILQLTNNALGGALPQSMANLAKLQQLRLANNKFTGPLPTGIGKTNLDRLELSNNMITGPLPDCIWNLPLETLDLSNNQIHTTIPPVWNNLTSIVMMDISNNQFYGPLPIKQTFPNLVNLFLNHNQLSGPLPDDLGLHFPNLEKMSLSFNQFNGSANGIRMLTNSRVLMLDHNQFDCELHPLLNMLSSVSILDLSYNNLRGSIPMTAIEDLFVQGSLSLFSVYGNPRMRSPTNALPPWLREDQSIVDGSAGVFLCNTLFATGRGALVFEIDGSYYDYEHCYCTPGFYGQPPNGCQRCPRGAHCPGGSTLTYDKGLYPVWELHSEFNESALVFQPCPDFAIPDTSCNTYGNRTISFNMTDGFAFDGDLCGPGTKGHMCSQCQCAANETDSQCYYRRINRCVACSSRLSEEQSRLFVGLFISALFAVLVTIFVGSQRVCAANKTLVIQDAAKEHAPPVSTLPTVGYAKIALIWIQTLAKLSAWPPQLWSMSLLVAILDVFNGEISPLGLPCAVPVLHNLEPRILFYMLSPIGLITKCFAALGFAWLVRSIIRRCRGGAKIIEEDYINDDLILSAPGQPHSTLQQIGVYITVVVFYVFYFGVSLDSFSLLNCSLTGSAGETYLETIPWIMCGSPEWHGLRKISILFIVAYAIGIPMSFFLLTVVFFKGRCVSPLFRARMKRGMSFLFSSYKSKFYWFESIVFLRRLLIAIIVGAVPMTSVFKVWAIFAILSVALLIQFWLQPFHTKMENKLEELSIVLLIITFAAQLSTSNPAHFMDTNDILPIVILCVNLLYAIMFIFAFVRARWKVAQARKHRAVQNLPSIRTPTKVTVRVS